MELLIKYEKGKVLQALRYHFISRREIKLMIILVNVFALLTAILFGYKMITPLPFLMSSVLWLSMMVAFWIWLPSTIYKRNRTFRDEFKARIEQHHFFIETGGVQKTWAWREIESYYETPGFFHLYFDSKTFFLIPKSAFQSEDQLEEARKVFRESILKK
jgi:hypothetical protein